MMQYDRIDIGNQAKELGFVRDTFEKVCRLAEVLRFIGEDQTLADSLALKGGTAINLSIFNLPRLSVDIDLDFTENISRDEMLVKRKQITSLISKYMEGNGYIFSGSTKNYHALDSFVFDYQNAGKTKDNLKIEINYMLRSHILPVERRKVMLPWMQDELSVLSVAPVEIFSAKIVALLTRKTLRDLFDVHNMVKYGIFDAAELDMLRKCAVFYSAVGAKNPPQNFELEQIDHIDKHRVVSDIYPVLRHGEKFNFERAQKEVKEYLFGFLVPTPGEQMFWREFENGRYCPELVFDGSELSRIKSHPMAAWKCQVRAQETQNPVPIKRRARKR